MGQILFGICHKCWVRLEIFGNKEIYENQKSLFGHQLSIPPRSQLPPSSKTYMYISIINYAKKISKFLDHVQIYFVMNILSSILDNTIYCNCYNVTCYINIHTFVIQDTYTHWKFRQYNMEPEKIARFLGFDWKHNITSKQFFGLASKYYNQVELSTQKYK